MSPFRYFKTAFANRWNVLALLAGLAFGLVSGKPDVVWPLVLAAEVAYVGLLGAHPKFRAFVDAQEAKAARTENARAAKLALRRILRALPRETLARFETLRSQCAELRQLARELKQPGKPDADVPLEGFQSAGLDRLLWIHLRLLYTHHALSRFLAKTPEEDIERDLRRTEDRLQRLSNQSGPQHERARKMLEDHLQTSRARLENLRKARDNFQLIGLEIERLENKIRSLSEMAINRQEPEYISSEVDHVATSMVETERTMNELQFATGLEAAADEPPALISTPIAQRA